MTGTFIFTTLLAVAIIICPIVALAWLMRSLNWEEVEDDQFQFRVAATYAHGWDRAKAWLRERPRMLTYRRDRRGRFRRHRR